MQNKYVADVTDFGKYGLLRFLTGMTAEDDLPPLPLGVVWYFHHDERHTGDRKKMSGDGERTGYLLRTPEDDKEGYITCDPILWDKLRDLLLRGARCVHCVQAAGILPKDTRWWDAAAPYLPGNSNAAKEARKEIRNLWLNGVTTATSKAQVVFLDPDNGLGEDGEKLNKGGAKYAYASDVSALWKQGKSIVLYHQPGHEKVLPDYRVAEALREITGRETAALRLRRGASPIFYVIPQERHRNVILNRCRKFADRWQKHFKEVRP